MKNSFFKNPPSSWGGGGGEMKNRMFQDKPLPLSVHVVW